MNKKRVNVLLFILLLVVNVTAVSAKILDLEVGRSRVLLPDQDQILTVVLTKPLVAVPQDMELELFIDGPATFKNSRKSIEVDFSELNWSSGLMKTYEEKVDLHIIKDVISKEKNITIYGNLTYYNEMFGYKKTNLSKESAEITFTVAWDITGGDVGLVRGLAEQNEELQGTLDSLKQNVEALNSEVDKLQSENEDLSKQVTSLQAELDQKNVDQMQLKIFKYSTIMLLVLVAIVTSFMFYYRSR